MTVCFSVSDPKIASDQGHAVCYLSFAPINRQYKIAVSNVLKPENNGSAYAYTLLEDTFVRASASKQKTTTFNTLEELLNTVFPKAASVIGFRVLCSFFSFMF